MGQPFAGEARSVPQAGPAHSHASSMHGNLSDEWEYEYSTEETEDVFFTLDLTTHVPDALERKNPSALGTQKAQKPRPTQTENDNAESAYSDDEEEDPSKLQIIDLHTPNPLIKLDDGVYSCYWTTDLGTQFHISQAGLTSNPLRSGTVLDVLGLSRARLSGQPVTLVDRNGSQMSKAQVATQKQSVSTAEENELEDEEFVPLNKGALQIPRGNLKSAKSLSQASFLERFSALKQRKGENDQVPVIAVKQYNAPANAEEIRQKALDDDQNSALLVDGRPRKRRRQLELGKGNRGAGRPGREAISRRVGFLDDSVGFQRREAAGMMYGIDGMGGMGGMGGEGSVVAAESFGDGMNAPKGNGLTGEVVDGRRAGDTSTVSAEMSESTAMLRVEQPTEAGDAVEERAESSP